MKRVIILGASGGLARHVIDELRKKDNVQLTLFLRNKRRLANAVPDSCEIIEGDVLDYEILKNSISGHDIVYVNLAGDLGRMGQNIVKAMEETGVKRVIAVSSIGIYETPLRSVLKPYRALADAFENSELDYTILRPTWFTQTDEIDYEITRKGEPEKGSVISLRSIAAFIAEMVDNPEKYVGDSLGINKPGS
jgi:uncharacterized protein YbjT (DUF2867 family)